MTETPAVPDGLADRLRVAGVEAVPTNAYAWLRSDGSVKYTYGDYEGAEPPRGAPDEWVPEGCVPLYVLRPVPVPTTCNERVMLTVRDYGPCVREKEHDGPHAALFAGREDVGLPAPAPTGETEHWYLAEPEGDKYRPACACGWKHVATYTTAYNALVTARVAHPTAAPAPPGEPAEQAAIVVWRALVDPGIYAPRPEYPANDDHWRCNAIVAALASAGLLSFPAQTPEPDERQRRYEHAVYHDVTACDDGKCPTCVAYQRGRDSALAASPAQTDPPAVHRAALREELWSPWCSGTAGWDAPLTVTASQVTCPACRAGRVDGERSPAPAQTGGEREWRAVLVASSGAEACLSGAEPEARTRERVAKYKGARLEWRTAPGPWSPVPSSETETPA